MAHVTEYVYGTFHLPPRYRRPPDQIATGHFALPFGATSPDVAISTMELDSWPKLHTRKPSMAKHGCLDMEDLQFEAEFLTWDQASQNTFVFACHLTSTLGIKVSWDPFHPD